MLFDGRVTTTSGIFGGVIMISGVFGSKGGFTGGVITTYGVFGSEGGVITTSSVFTSGVFF